MLNEAKQKKNQMQMHESMIPKTNKNQERKSNFRQKKIKAKDKQKDN